MNQGPSIESLRAVAGDVSRETFERMLGLERMVRRWNTRINLMSSTAIQDLWRRHILDSAQLAAIKPDATRWLDLGSGGGFPGLVMGVLLVPRGGTVDLIESNRKKAAFLQSAAIELGLPAKVHAVRIADAAQADLKPDIVTARALAPLPELLGLAAPWLTRGATGLFHKGRDYRREIQESVHGWRFDLVEHRSATDADGVVLEISGLTSGSAAEHGSA